MVYRYALRDGRYKTLPCGHMAEVYWRDLSWSHGFGLQTTRFRAVLSAARVVC